MTTTFWILVAGFVGFWWGTFVTGFLWKRTFKTYTEELHRQYGIALDKMRIKYINQNNVELKEGIDASVQTDNTATKR